MAVKQCCKQTKLHVSKSRVGVHKIQDMVDISLEIYNQKRPSLPSCPTSSHYMQANEIISFKSCSNIILKLHSYSLVLHVNGKATPRQLSSGRTAPFMNGHLCLFANQQPPVRMIPDPWFFLQGN